MRNSPTSPAGLPELSAGSHRRPEQGSCLMEYVSVLAGQRFSDRPRCTHPNLAGLARQINDTTSTAGRPRLARLAPDLIGTRCADRRVPAAILACCADAGLNLDPRDGWLLKMRRRATRPQRRLNLLDHRHLTSATVSRGLGRLRDLPTDRRDEWLYQLLERAIAECHRLQGTHRMEDRTEPERRESGSSL